MAVLTGLAAPGIAQTPADRSALAHLRDSLQAIQSADRLPALTGDDPGSGSPALIRIRKGMIEARRGELTGERADFERALTDLDEAAFRESDWPWVWFALATTKAEMARRNLLAKPRPHQPIGLSYYAAFERHLGRTLRLDPGFAPAVEFLVRTLTAEGDREQPPAFLAPLERLASRPGADPRVFLILARAARTAGRPDSALALFRLYQARGGDSSVAQLELARALRAVGRTAEAVAAYRQGLRDLTPEGRAAYRSDFGWIATPAELARFDSLPADSLPGWAEQFWSLRDAESIREPGSRLAEHLRRWNYAYRHFRVLDPGSRTQFERVPWLGPGPCRDRELNSLDDLSFLNPSRSDDLRHRERLLDDRAVIYIRHGAPAQRLRSVPTSDRLEPATADQEERRPAAAIDPDQATGQSPTTTGQVETAFDQAEPAGSVHLDYWVYWIAGQTRIYQFDGSGALGSQAPTTLSAEPIMDYNVLMSLARFDGRYARLAHRLALSQRGYLHSAVPLSCDPRLRAIRRQRQTDLATSVSTDSYTLLFPTTIPVIVQTFAVGRPEQGDSRLLVEFAIPGEQLVAEPRPDSAPGVAYRVRFRVTAVDSVRGTVRRLDTTRTFLAADTLRSGSTLDGYLELAVPAGTFTVRSAVFQPGRGASLERPEVAFTPAAGALALSDLVLGRPGSSLVWTAPDGQPVRLNPLATFPEGGELELYYELSGAEPGRSYRTTVGIRRAQDRDERRGLRLVFTDPGTARRTAFRRSLDLTRLRPGRYQLSVTVAEVGTGRTITREQAVVVVKR